MPDIEPGTTVYLLDGREAEYVAPNPGGGHIIQPFYEAEGWDGDPYIERGNIDIAADIFRAPPTEKIQSEIAAMIAERDAVQSEIWALQADKHEAERDTNARAERLKRHADTAMIDKFVSGQIHYLVVDEGYGWKARKWPDEFKDHPDRNHSSEIRLIGMHGTINGKREWRVNRWSDGSGGSNPFFACETEEEAKALAEKKTSADLRLVYDNAVRGTNPGYQTGQVVEWVKRLRASGHVIPDDIATFADDAARKAAQADVDRKRAELDAAIAKAAALEKDA